VSPAIDGQVCRGGLWLSDDPADTAWIGFTVALAAWSTDRLEVALEPAAQAVDEMYATSGSSDDFVHMCPAAVELALQTDATASLDRLLGIVDAEARPA
jgi:hypothetical protein